MLGDLVSVNVTTYNRAALLPRCLDSILAQTYRNLEVVIVDDCSQDETQAVVKAFQARDHRVRYFRHDTNQGNAYARNTALQHCHGPYVAFMDDDDEWIDRDKLAKQVAMFERHSQGDLGIVCSSVRLFSDESTHRDKIVRRPANLVQHILGRNGIIYSPTVLTTRAIMTRAGGFDTKLKRGIDSDFYRTCIVKFGYDVVFLEDVTTAIHEYGSDRITLQNTCAANLKVLKSQIYLLSKYKRHFLKHPKPALQRLRHAANSLWKLRKCLPISHPYRNLSNSVDGGNRKPR